MSPAHDPSGLQVVLRTRKLNSAQGPLNPTTTLYFPSNGEKIKTAADFSKLSGDSVSALF